MISALINRPAIGNFPSSRWASDLKDGLMRVAPKGLDQVFTAQSGSEANELAFKAAFMYYRRKQRGERVEWSAEEIKTALSNQQPGSPDLAVLSFRNSFHGRGFGSLSATRSKAVHKMDIPSFKWPQASFPKLKYPLDKFEAENEAEERRCLEEAETLLDNWHCPVAAVIIEPIQSEGGDNHASSKFFQSLQGFTKNRDIILIVDEVQTGECIFSRSIASVLMPSCRLRSHWKILGERALAAALLPRHFDILQEGPNRRLFLRQQIAAT
jgi:4-aminobutyrate aminotransferase/(S)-3-amino-2-methylpropionate transaminase